MTSRARTVGAAAVLAYVGTLFALATPEMFFPEALVTARRAARNLVHDLRLDAGQGVFNDHFPGRKRLHTCIAVLGEGPRGTFRYLHRTFGDCTPPPVRFRMNAVDLIHFRLLRDTAEWQVRQPEAKVTALRESIALGLSRYHCAAADPPVRRVYVTWLQQWLDYETGEVTGRADLAFEYDCELDARVADPDIVLEPSAGGPALRRVARDAS